MLGWLRKCETRLTWDCTIVENYKKAAPFYIIMYHCEVRGPRDRRWPHLRGILQASVLSRYEKRNTFSLSTDADHNPTNIFGKGHAWHHSILSHCKTFGTGTEGREERWRLATSVAVHHSLRSRTQTRITFTPWNAPHHLPPTRGASRPHDCRSERSAAAS